MVRQCLVSLIGSFRPEQCHLCRLTFKYKKTLVLAHTLSILYYVANIRKVEK